jgi:CheY-like chemotaxis protein
MKIVDEILDLSKIESGKLSLEHLPFSLREALASMLRALVVRAVEKGLELDTDVASEVPDGLLGDHGRLRQVVTNIVGNAIKFTHTGKIAVRVTADSQVANESVLLHFTVSDTGIGIPSDKQALIFQPFVQADGSMTRTYGGTGLGLTIAQQLTELMGGRIWVESEVGKGSHFHFTVQMEVQRDGLAQPAPDRPPDVGMPVRSPGQLKPLRVLVAEDNPINRRMMIVMLENQGHVVIAVENGRQALAILDAEAVDVVLLDVQMPVMDGFAVTAEVRRRESTSGDHLPIVAVTAHAMAGDRERCIRAGMDGYLRKPIELNELLATITAVMGGSRVSARPGDPSVAALQQSGERFP